MTMKTYLMAMVALCALGVRAEIPTGPVDDGIYAAADLKEGDPLYGHLVGGTLHVGKFGALLIVR